MTWFDFNWISSVLLQQEESSSPSPSPSPSSSDGEDGAIVPLVAHGDNDDSLKEEVTRWKSAVEQLVHLTNQCLGIDDIDHIQQSHDWDCGIVCLEMVIQAWFAGASVSREWLAETINTQSTWTADVVFVLQTFLQECLPSSSSSTTVSYIFSSQSLAVNENLKSLPFYAPQFARDAERVQARLKLVVPDHGFQRTRPYPLSEILNCVQYQDCVAILLVDANMLRGDNNNNNNNNSSSSTLLPYTGHYVLVVGVLGRTMVYVNDPGMGNGRQRIPVERLERAWHAIGTDADVIVMVRHPKSSSS